VKLIARFLSMARTSGSWGVSYCSEVMFHHHERFAWIFMVTKVTTPPTSGLKRCSQRFNHRIDSDHICLLHLAGA